MTRVYYKDMDIFTVVIIVVVLLAAQGISLYFILRRREPPTENGGMVLLQQQLQNLEKTLDARVSESSKAMQENSHRQFSESSRLIKEISQLSGDVKRYVPASVAALIKKKLAEGRTR